MRNLVVVCGLLAAACGGAPQPVKSRALEWEMVNNVQCAELAVDEVHILGSAADADALKAAGKCAADTFANVDWAHKTVVGLASLGTGCKVSVMWTARRDGDAGVLLGHVLREDGDCQQIVNVASFLVIDKVDAKDVKVTRRRTKSEAVAPSE